MKRTARVVVGPEERFGDRSQADMEANHWESLLRTLHEHGVAADAAKLGALSHDLELSDRLLALSDAKSLDECRERGLD